MVKQEIIAKVAERTNMSEYEARMAVESTIEAIKDVLLTGENVIFRGFGTFKVVRRAPKKVRDINNGIQFSIASKRRVVFKPGNTLTLD